MPTITALKAFPCNGRQVQPGETVDVRPIEAASLTYRGLARLGARVTTAAMAVEPVAEEVAAKAPRRRRNYRRRDLVAEE